MYSALSHCLKTEKKKKARLIYRFVSKPPSVSVTYNHSLKKFQTGRKRIFILTVEY